MRGNKGFAYPFVLLLVTIIFIYSLFISQQLLQLREIRMAFEGSRLSLTSAMISAYNSMNEGEGEYTFTSRNTIVHVIVKEAECKEMFVTVGNDKKPYYLYTRGQQLLVGSRE